MKFYDLKGRERQLKNASQYLVKWDGGNLSKFQERIKSYLYAEWAADIVFEELPVVGSRMRIDFYNATRNQAIEVDGNQHYRYNKHFHQKSRMNFLKQLKRDNDKEKFCRVNGITLIRIAEEDPIASTKDLLKFIEDYE